MRQCFFSRPSSFGFCVLGRGSRCWGTWSSSRSSPLLLVASECCRPRRIARRANGLGPKEGARIFRRPFPPSVPSCDPRVVGGKAVSSSGFNSRFATGILPVPFGPFGASQLALNPLVFDPLACSFSHIGLSLKPSTRSEAVPDRRSTSPLCFLLLGSHGWL